MTTPNFTVSTAAGHGTTSINATSGAWSYTPTADYFGADSFVVSVTDNNGNTETKTISLMVTGVVDITDDNTTVAEDSAPGITTDVLTNDSFENTPTITAVTQGTNGSVVIVDAALGTVKYTPNANFNGSDSYTYTVTSGGVTETATVNVTVTQRNDRTPGAVADAITVAEGGTATALVGAATSVKANDIGLLDTPVNVSLVTDVSHGTLTLNADGSFSYIHDGSENFSDSFVYRLTDNGGQTSDATVTITITPVSDAVRVTGDTSGSGNEDTAITGTLTALDMVDGGIFSVTTNASHGTASISAISGLWNYIPTADYFGTDSFTVTLTDDKGHTVTQVISITVSAMADIVGDSLTTNRNIPITANLITTGAGSDNFEGSPTLTSVTQGDHGSVSFAPDGTVTYTPSANFNGADSFTYTVTSGGVTETVTVNVTVSPVNQPANISADIGNVTEDSPTNSIASGTVVLTDPDAGEAALQPQANSTGSYGHFSIDSAGNWSYTLDNSNPLVQALSSNQTSTDVFAVHSIDGTPSTVTITIYGSDETPAPALSYNTTIFVEAPANDGSITTISTITLSNDTFTGANGAALGTVSNVPTGLTAVLVKTSDTTATLSLTGHATDHTNAQDMANLTVSFVDADFTGGKASAVNNATRADLMVDFADPLAPDQAINIISMSRDSGAADFVTNDGGANRTVSGTLGALLNLNEVVEVSFDNGLTWSTATTSGTNWTVIDNSSHATDWIIQARVTNAATGIFGSADRQAVTLDTVAPTAPAVNALISTDTTPTLTGTANVGTGEALTVTINGATYPAIPDDSGIWSLNLATATPTAGLLIPLTRGSSYSVTATVTDIAGNVRSDVTANELTVLAEPVPAPPAPPAPPAALPAETPVDTPPAPSVPPISPTSPLGSTLVSVNATSDTSSPQSSERSAFFEESLTSAAGFRAAVIEANEPSLTVFRGITDQYVDENKSSTFALPYDAFVHTRPEAVVTLLAKLTDGSDLPGWIKFDARSGTFQLDSPPGLADELEIQVIARDSEGREATVIFRVFVGDAKAKPQGRMGLSDQIRLAAARSSPWLDKVRVQDGKHHLGRLQVVRQTSAPSRVPA